MPDVTWKLHPIHSNYEASTDGRVRSIDRTITRSDGTTRYRRGQELKPFLWAKSKTQAHASVRLGRKVQVFVYRFVCETFHGLPPTPRHQVRFTNGDSEDCRPENLVWVYPADEFHTQWQGVDVSYGGLHKRLRKERGSADARECVDCGDQAAQWSYDHSDPNEKRGSVGPYSLDMDRYQPRCRRCHILFDRRGDHAKRAS
jgi:HNH endonuclease